MLEVLVGVALLLFAAIYPTATAELILLAVLIAAVPVARKHYRAVHQRKK